MLKDNIMRRMFVPILGIGISYLSGIVNYRSSAFLKSSGGAIFFTFTSFLIWKGCQWLHIRLRGFYTENQKVFSKLGSVIFLSAVYGFAISGIMGLLWFQVNNLQVVWNTFNKFILTSVFAIIIFTLVYEILYLSKEREIDTQVVDQLDKELSEAEIHALRNEIDPHFIFNSLTTLSQLISHDSNRAIQFNNTLTNVYKYYLVHKNTRYISLEKEINFVKSYFYLLQIRHENKLSLTTNLQLNNGALTFPCSLQLLVENAIKHNEFSEEAPLNIHIISDDQYITVKNTIRPVKNVVPSTQIGLRNLSAQFRVLTGKKIKIAADENFYSVQIPLIHPENIES